jgi:ribose transport system permease protein
MLKLLGNVVVLAVLYGALVLDPETSSTARRPENHQYLAERIGQYGILSLAAGILIITGGIDLSIGSTVALTSVVLWKLLMDYNWPPAVAIPAVLLLGALIGLGHGLLVAVARIQAFIVTLCGLLVYRSIARWLTGDRTVGLESRYEELKDFCNGYILGVPVHFWLFIGLLLVLGIFLHFSVYGRYFYAIGSNEKAARYCGIPTTRYKISAYVLCSTLAAFFAVLNMMKMNSVQPSTTGNFFELYGIAAAVMGGCSLRGGEGNVLGIFLGTCIIYVLPNYVFFKGVPSSLEGAIFGLALLVGAFADEMLRRYYGYRAS